MKWVQIFNGINYENIFNNIFLYTFQINNNE